VIVKKGGKGSNTFLTKKRVRIQDPKGNSIMSYRADKRPFIWMHGEASRLDEVRREKRIDCGKGAPPERVNGNQRYSENRLHTCAGEGRAVFCREGGDFHIKKGTV